MIEITDFSSHIIWLEKKIDKTGGHQTSQERSFYFCAPTSTPFFEHWQTHHVNQVFFIFFLPSDLRSNRHFCRLYLYDKSSTQWSDILHANYLFKPSAWGGGFFHAEGVCMAYREESPRFFWPNYTHTSPIMLNGKSTIYIADIEIFHACGAKNFVSWFARLITNSRLTPAP